MHKTGRYLYVAFMCQQAIEKYLKAIICEKTSKMPPYVHNLTTLSEYLELNLSEVQLDLLDILSKYYINARYPIVKQSLAKSLDEKSGRSILTRTEDFLKWLKRK